MVKKLFGLVVAGIVGALVTFAVMVLLGSSWREAMPASTLIGVVLPCVIYYVVHKSTKSENG